MKFTIKILSMLLHPRALMLCNWTQFYIIIKVFNQFKKYTKGMSWFQIGSFWHDWLKMEVCSSIVFLCMEKPWTSLTFGVNTLFNLELELRAWTCKFGRLILGFDDPSIIEKLKLLTTSPIPKFVKIWANINCPFSKWDIKGGGTKEKRFLDKPKNKLEIPLV